MRLHSPVRTLIATLVVGLLLGTGVVSRPALAATQNDPDREGLSIRLLEAPVERRDDPRARRFIVDHIHPGDSISRKIEVANNTSQRATIELYAVRAEIKDDAFIAAAGREGNELSSWVTVQPSTLELAPGALGQATITVKVPSDASAGERYAGVLAELPPPPGTGGVGVSKRVGVRLYVSVGPGGEPPTDFALESFAPVRSADGRPGVAIHACNTGGRALDLAGELSLDNGPGGTSAGPFNTAGATVVPPKACTDVQIALDPAIPAGPWDATVKLRSGPKEKAATARITFPSAGKHGAPVRAKEVTGTSRGRLLLLIALLLLLLIIVLLLLLLRRRKREQDEQIPSPV